MANRVGQIWWLTDLTNDGFNGPLVPGLIIKYSENTCPHLIKCINLQSAKVFKCTINRWLDPALYCLVGERVI